MGTNTLAGFCSLFEMEFAESGKMGRRQDS